MVGGGQQRLIHLWFECKGQSCKVPEEPSCGNKLDLRYLRLDPLTIALDDVVNLVDSEGWTKHDIQGLQGLVQNTGITKETAIKVEGDPGPGAASGSGQAGAGAGAAASAGRIGMSMEQLVYELPKLLSVMYMFTTPRSDSGERIQQLQVSLVERVLREVPPLPMTPAMLVKALAHTKACFDFAARARREDDVQKCYNAITATLVALRARHGGQVLHACDTSTQGYPMYPCHDIDISVCTCEKPPPGRQVLWSSIASAMELTCNALKDEADVLQQLHSRAIAMFERQPARSVFIGVAGDGHCLQVVRFERHFEGTIERTDWLPFMLSTESSGLMALARILLSAPEQLGYVAPKSIHTFSVTVDEAEWSVTPQQLLQETGKPGDAAKASLVYSCHSDNLAGGQCEGVLKIGPMAEYEADVIKGLNEAGISAQIPKVWHSGSLPDLGSYVIIQPRGNTIDFDVPTTTLLSVVEDVANALDFLASKKVLHLDIAPNNIVLHQDRGMLVDFGISRQGGTFSIDQGIGRLAFKSIQRLNADMASLSGELESLFYTLLFWVCEGHLPWRHAVTAELALLLKWMVMTLRFEELLSHCRTPDVPVLKRLHALFFPGSSKEGYRTDVCVAEFINALSPTVVV